MKVIKYNMMCRMLVVQRIIKYTKYTHCFPSALRYAFLLHLNSGTHCMLILLHMVIYNHFPYFEVFSQNRRFASGTRFTPSHCVMCIFQFCCHHRRRRRVYYWHSFCGVSISIPISPSRNISTNTKFI